jgi:uncharacterized membrane protein
MSLDFAVAQFDGEGAAVESYSAARDRAGEEARWMREVGFVEHRHSGLLALRGTFAGHYVDVDESDHVSQRGAGEGAAAGGLIGVLLGPPGIAVGLLLGLIVGAERGPSSETEAEPQALVDQLRSAVPRSSSAVVLIAEAPDVDDMLAALGESAQSTSRQTLTTDQAAELEASLSAAPRAAPGSSARGL